MGKNGRLAGVVEKQALVMWGDVKGQTNGCNRISKIVNLIQF